MFSICLCSEEYWKQHVISRRKGDLCTKKQVSRRWIKHSTHWKLCNAFLSIHALDILSYGCNYSYACCWWPCVFNWDVYKQHSDAQVPVQEGLILYSVIFTFYSIHASIIVARISCDSTITRINSPPVCVTLDSRGCNALLRGFPDFRYQIASCWLLLLVDEFAVLAPLITGAAARLFITSTVYWCMASNLEASRFFYMWVYLFAINVLFE